MTEWSATVLRNKGVPVNTQKLSEGGDLLFDRNEEPITEERWVKFTINVISQLETLYQGKKTYAPDGGEMVAIGTMAWQDFLRASPVSTTRAVLALMWEMKVEEAGRIMLASEMGNYAGALVSAFAIAEGVDPLVATAAVQAQVEAAVAAARSNFHQDSPPVPPPS